MDRKPNETANKYWERHIRENVRSSKINRIANFCVYTLFAVLATVVINALGVASQLSCFFWVAAIWNWYAATIIMSIGDGEFPIPRTYPEMQWVALIVIATIFNTTMATFTPSPFLAFAGLEFGGAVLFAITALIVMELPNDPPWPPRYL